MYRLPKAGRIVSGQEKCLFCKLEIKPKASICPHCLNYQNKNWSRLIRFSSVTAFIIVLVSVGQLIAVYNQYKEAQKKRL